MPENVAMRCAAATTTQGAPPRARACVCASHAHARANRTHARGTPMHRQVAALSGGRRTWHVDLARVGLAADIVGAGAKAVLPHVPLDPEIAEQHSHRAPRAARPRAVPVRASGTQCTQCAQTDNAHATMRVAFSPERGPPWDHGAHNEAALNRGESVCLAAGWCAAAAYTPPTYIRICGASASWARCAEPMTRSPPLTIMTLCPSGLRGWTQVPLAQAAWVQIPQVSVNCFRGAVHARMAGARQRPQHRPQQWRTSWLGRSGGATHANHPFGRTVHSSIRHRRQPHTHTHNPFRQTTRWSCLLVCAPPRPTHQHPESRAGAAPAITRVMLMSATPCAATATRCTQAKHNAATAHGMLSHAHARARMLTTCTCTSDQCTDMELRCRKAAHLAHTPGQDRTGDLQRVGLTS